MYKGTSKNMQNRADALTIKNLSVGEVYLTQEQKWESLKSAWKAAQEQLLTYPKKHPKRKELGFEMQRLQDEIKKVRTKPRRGNSLADCFMEVARLRLTKPEYKIWIKQAEEIFSKQQEEEI